MPCNFFGVIEMAGTLKTNERKLGHRWQGILADMTYPCLADHLADHLVPKHQRIHCSKGKKVTEPKNLPMD